MHVFDHVCNYHDKRPRDPALRGSARLPTHGPDTSRRACATCWVHPPCSFSPPFFEPRPFGLLDDPHSPSLSPRFFLARAALPLHGLPPTIVASSLTATSSLPLAPPLYFLPIAASSPTSNPLALAHGALPLCGISPPSPLPIRSSRSPTLSIALPLLLSLSLAHSRCPPSMWPSPRRHCCLLSPSRASSLLPSSCSVVPHLHLPRAALPLRGLPPAVITPGLMAASSVIVEKLPASSIPDLPGIKLKAESHRFRSSLCLKDFVLFGIPVKLLHEAAGHIVMVELKNDELYRRSMVDCDGN